MVDKFTSHILKSYEREARAGGLCTIAGRLPLGFLTVICTWGILRLLWFESCDVFHGVAFSFKGQQRRRFEIILDKRVPNLCIQSLGPRFVHLILLEFVPLVFLLLDCCHNNTIGLVLVNHCFVRSPGGL